MKRLIALLFLLASPSFATTTVTGTINNLGTGSSGSATFVRFWLRGCGGNQPRVSGTAVIAPSQGGVFYFDIAANSSGAVSGTLYSTRDSTGNSGGEIECGGSTTSEWYGMQIFVNGQGGPETPIQARNTTTIDISNVTPITMNPVVTAPTGDTTYFRIDGGNSGLKDAAGTITASEPIQVGIIDNIFKMDGVTYPFTGAGLLSCVAAANAANSGAGGICDARGMQGAVTLLSALTVGTGTGNKTQLLLGPVTITTSATISIQQNSSIVGLPQSNNDGTSAPATTIVQANGTNLSCIVNFSGNLGVMQDILVNGNKANNATSTDDGVCINNARATLNRVTSEYNQRYGFHVISTGTSNQAAIAKFTQIMSEFNGSSGLRCDASTDIEIGVQSEFENNGAWGIDNFDCSGMDIEDNDISGGTSGGLRIQGISTGWTGNLNLVRGNRFGNNLGPDLFIEGSCSDSTSTLCSRGNVINGNRFVGLGSGAASNTIDAIKVQDSASNTITGNVCASQAPQSYKYCLEILQPNRTEGNDTVAGNEIDATSSFGTGYFFPQANTICMGNNDPANLCTFRIPSGYLADFAQNNAPSNPASGLDRINFDASDVFGPLTSAGAFTRSKWSGLIATGTATLTGTGACATNSTQKGGAWAGQATCTGTTGASTFIITPGTTAPNGWSCTASDLTTSANILRQSAVSTTACTIAGTVNANDVLTFTAVAY